MRRKGISQSQNTELHILKFYALLFLSVIVTLNTKIIQLLYAVIF